MGREGTHQEEERPDGRDENGGEKTQIELAAEQIQSQRIVEQTEKSALDESEKTFDEQIEAGIEQTENVSG